MLGRSGGKETSVACLRDQWKIEAEQQGRGGHFSSSFVEARQVVEHVLGQLNSVVLAQRC